MSRKRTKQYLMLLMVIGLVSIAAGGGGTFASFSAETSNAGNYFATGTLVLNDNGGNNTCTSATGTGTVNTANSSATDCDTLFKVDHFSFGATTLNQASLSSGDGANATITVAAITGSALYPGDVLTIDNGTDPAESLPVLAYAAVGALQINVNASGLAHTYTTGNSITDNNDTQLASLTLTNAGTIDAKDITFKAGNGCTVRYTEPTTTLALGGTQTLHAASPTTLAIASTGLDRFKAGDTLIVSQSGHANTFIVATDQTIATSVDVTVSEPWNFAYTNAAVVSGPEFHGAGNANAQDLCSHLDFSIIETTGTFPASLGAAAGCAFGTPSGGTCDLTAGTDLASVSSTLSPLSIATGSNGNSSGLLNAGKSRTFQLVVRYDGASAFDNTYQNTSAAAFDLTWHIDQV